MAAWMRADSSAMRSPSRSRSGGSWDCGGAALSCSASARVVVSLAPAAINPVVTVDVGCSAVENSGHPAGVAARGRVLASGDMAAWYTRFSTPSCCPVSEPFTRFRLFGPNLGAAGREHALRAETRAESAEPGTSRNNALETVSTPLGPKPAIFSIFLHVGPTATPIARLLIRCHRNRDARPEVRGVESTRYDTGRPYSVR